MSTSRFKTRIAAGIPALALAIALTACNHKPSEQPYQPHDIYSESADAHADIQGALAKAAREHKRVILDFGGNWCGDCKVLDYYLHRQPNAGLVDRNFVLVDIDIGRYDKNLDIAQQYGVPLNKGVPALAVLDGNGQLLYSQRNGEFEAMRKMDPASVTQFLDQWMPKKNG